MLVIGSKLGPYEIQGAAGAGGMGEVYRARDTRLERTVAIKVLPARLSDDPNLRQRLEREAKAISNLSHPNICVLYDVGEQDGTGFLVMEFLEGETLDQRLQRGPLPPAEVLNYGLQIADALDKAHHQGVIHRDLKPSNVMLTKSGAKLMDFGLAKLGDQQNPLTAALTDMTADEKKLTTEGTILGTFQYMAPEQLEGNPADSRSDIFSFGALLYEMATGKPAFKGKTRASLIASILSAEPPSITSVAPMTPPALERVVKHCLAKDPDERFQSAHDLKLHLEWIAEAGSQAGVPAPVVARREHREWMAWAVAAVSVLGLIIVAAVWFSRQHPEHATFAHMLPPDKANFQFNGDNGGPLAISPDGRKMVFLASFGGKLQLWVRSLDIGKAEPLQGTDGGMFPFWSPDSRSIAFFARGKMYSVYAAGGPVIPITEAINPRGGSWGPSGIIFTPDTRDGIYRVGTSGGKPELITKVDTNKHSTHRWPYLMPDGKHFIYLASNHDTTKREYDGVYFASVDGKQNKLLVSTNASAIYASGYLLFQRNNNLVAQLMDPSSGELSGEPLPLADNVQFDPGIWKGMFTASQEGTLAFATGAADGGTQLVWFDRGGKQLSSLPDRDPKFGLRLSPDGQRLAVEVGDPTSDIWIYELNRGVRTRLTFHPSLSTAPVWTKDGRQVIYAADYSGNAELYAKPSNGSAGEQQLLKSDKYKSAMDTSPDGKYLLFLAGAASPKIMLMNLADHSATALLPNDQFFQVAPQFSPDGKWVAYQSNESGRWEIYVVPFPAPGGKWQVSVNGGSVPRWRRDGKMLYYVDAESSLTEVPVEARNGDLQVGQAKPLFRVANITVARALFFYDVTPDGQRFIVNMPLEGASAPLSVVVNWQAVLKKQ